MLGAVPVFSFLYGEALHNHHRSPVVVQAVSSPLSLSQSDSEDIFGRLGCGCYQQAESALPLFVVEQQDREPQSFLPYHYPGVGRSEQSCDFPSLCVYQLLVVITLSLLALPLQLGAIEGHHLYGCHLNSSDHSGL